jgi:ATP-dependent exoDNAse (exonuclease V) beta subunit
LRAPWCGLSLNDLLILGNDKKITVWEQLQSNLVAKLSDEAQIRLHRIIPTLKIKMAERNRGSLKFRIESTWILLGGPACLADQNDLADAKTFFKLLDELDTGGDLANLDNFHQQVSQQFAAADNSSSPTLQIMTIHNSKGLEFDTVILPALDRQAAHDDRPLLLWMERMEVHSSSLLLAPVNAVGEESDPIYNYIKMQHQLKNDYEMSRLLYVAATRAKKNLHLFFNINEMRPSSNSLLEKLWPSIAREVTQINVCENPTIPEAPTQTNVFSLKRLATTWINPISERKSESSFHNQNEGFVFNINTSRLIGTIIHKVLQQIGCQGIEWWSNSSENSHRAYLRNHLLQIGLPKQDLSSSIQIIEKAITNCIVDEKGKWIFAKHIDTQTEFAITTIIDNKPHQLIIDRTFVDEDGFRWIIDYKNTHFSDDLPMFLESEKLKYAKQMRYYHEAMQAHDSRPIKLGLYFPLIPSWIEWTF